MYDCSTVSYEENVERVAEMVKICHAMGVTVEAELGHVGDNAGAGKLENPEDYYTDPDTALDYITRTGADSLAVAVGNAHGDYAFPPKLDFDRIDVISKKVNIHWCFTVVPDLQIMISGRRSNLGYPKSIFSRISTKREKPVWKPELQQEREP